MTLIISGVSEQPKLVNSGADVGATREKILFSLARLETDRLNQCQYARPEDGTTNRTGLRSSEKPGADHSA